jgi:small-conductance mechanosensitive channel
VLLDHLDDGLLTFKRGQIAIHQPIIWQKLIGYLTIFVTVIILSTSFNKFQQNAASYC